ncbi:hypothetical protein ACLOJK_012839 [Asimina triloba]
MPLGLKARPDYNAPGPLDLGAMTVTIFDLGGSLNFLSSYLQRPDSLPWVPQCDIVRFGAVQLTPHVSPLLLHIEKGVRPRGVIIRVDCYKMVSERDLSSRLPPRSKIVTVIAPQIQRPRSVIIRADCYSNYVERLLDRISNGVLADDRRSAMTELQSIVAESHFAQLALGATGLPVLLTILREEREDVEMVSDQTDMSVTLTSLHWGDAVFGNACNLLLPLQSLYYGLSLCSYLGSVWDCFIFDAFAEEKLHERLMGKRCGLSYCLACQGPSLVVAFYLMTTSNTVSLSVTWIRSDDAKEHSFIVLVTRSGLYRPRPHQHCRVLQAYQLPPSSSPNYTYWRGPALILIIDHFCISNGFTQVRGALETLVSALTPIGRVQGPKNESEDDFYTRYYTLQLLTALLTNSSSRLQEAILAIPRGISRLMDMLMDREEIQKIVVFEGAFEKIFSIIKEEGGSEGGVVVQDCLELLNNLLRNSASNKETVGFEPLISILKLRKGSAYSFNQQKTVNLLSALDTVALLLTGSPDIEPGKDANRLSNQTALAQNKILDHLLVLGVESKWAAVAVRCSALQCIGKLVVRHPQNLDTLASKVVGEEPHVEPALNSILRVALRSSSLQEFIAADYVFKCFCQKNKEGQAILSSTMTLQPHSVSHAEFDEGANMPFGRFVSEFTSKPEYFITLCLLGYPHKNQFDQSSKIKEIPVVRHVRPLQLEMIRAASILSHILMDNIHCKERALRVELEPPSPSLGSPEPLMHRVMRYLTLASSMKIKGNDQERTSDGNLYIQPIIMRLLVTWLAECPTANQLFLESPAHLSNLLELVSSTSASTYVRGLAAILLGECVLYNNRSSEDGRDAFAVVDSISQKVGLTSYLLRFDEMQKGFAFVSVTTSQNRKPLSRSNAASTMDVEDTVDHLLDQKQEHPILLSIFDMQFVTFVKKLEADIRESIVEVFSRPKNTVTVVPVELEQKGGESDGDYIKRLKSFVEKQCKEMQVSFQMASVLFIQFIEWFNVALCKSAGNNYRRTEIDNRAFPADSRIQVQHLVSLNCVPFVLTVVSGIRAVNVLFRQGTSVSYFCCCPCCSFSELLARNAILAEDLAKTGGGNDSASDHKTDGVQARVQNENLRRDLQKAIQRVEMLEAEKAKIESELSEYRNKAEKFKSDLESLSEAYNSLDQVNLQLDSEVKALKRGSGGPVPDLEAIKAESREEALKESEGELNDLLVCLGQEQSKVEKLSARLTELGEDVDSLLEGIGDDAGLPEDGEDEDDD